MLKEQDNFRGKPEDFGAVRVFTMTLSFQPDSMNRTLLKKQKACYQNSTSVLDKKKIQCHKITSNSTFEKCTSAEIRSTEWWKI